MESYGSQVWQRALGDSIDWMGGAGGIISSVIIFAITVFLSWKQKGRKAINGLISSLKGAGVVCAAWVLILLTQLCVLAPKALVEYKQKQISALEGKISLLTGPMSVENRPYLWVKAASMSDLKPGQSGTITLIFENAGKTPAFDLTVKLWLIEESERTRKRSPRNTTVVASEQSIHARTRNADYDPGNFRNGSLRKSSRLKRNSYRYI